MLSWSMNPIALELGPIAIRWYGLFFGTGFYIGYRILLDFYTKDKLPTQEVEQLFTYVFLGTLIGARVGHFVFYEPDLLLEDPFRVFKVWEGGLASHGGGLGIFAALWLFFKKPRALGFLKTLDRLAIVIALGGAFIRMGNFFNSEILGIPSNAPWAIRFEMVDLTPRHPAQLYESISYAISFGILYFLYIKKEAGKKSGFLFGLFLILIFTTRFFIEFIKENQVAFEKGLPLNMGQILSIPMIALGIFFLRRSFNKKIS